MKFSFDKKQIQEVLSKIQGITGRKTTLSITCDVLIKAVGSKITIIANDLETVFSGTYEASEASVEEEGIISINSKKFFEIVREYPENTILVNEVENRWIEIGQNDCIYHIMASDYTNFPETPVVEDVNFIQIASKDLKKMVDVSSIITCSGDEKRIYVLGALLEKISDNGTEKLRIVSTDSRRLNFYEADFEGELLIPEKGVIIPKKGLSELNKFLGVDNEPVNMGIHDNNFVFQRENESIMIKLLEGEYPNYKPVLNYDGIIPIEMDRSMFSTLMKRISILTSEEYKSVVLNFNNNELIVTITNPEIGESKERMMVAYSGENIKSAFNPRYFIDALSLFEEDTIALHVKGSQSPCIIRSTNKDNLICVIMAMHIS